MADEIKVGDQVELKSGGPTMTVDSLGKPTIGAMQANCSWFDEKNKKQKASFPLTSLKRVD
jgi:uncharacterized protein YodC (DUF2158 family)